MEGSQLFVRKGEGKRREVVVVVVDEPTAHHV